MHKWHLVIAGLLADVWLLRLVFLTSEICSGWSYGPKLKCNCKPPLSEFDFPCVGYFLVKDSMKSLCLLWVVYTALHRLLPSVHFNLAATFRLWQHNFCTFIACKFEHLVLNTTITTSAPLHDFAKFKDENLKFSSLLTKSYSSPVLTACPWNVGRAT